jgi:hypothetical protein
VKIIASLLVSGLRASGLSTYILTSFPSALLKHRDKFTLLLLLLLLLLLVVLLLISKVKSKAIPVTGREGP